MRILKLRLPATGTAHATARGIAWVLCLLSAAKLVQTSAGKIKNVDSSLGLWEAFQDSRVTTIRVTKDIILNRDVWPGDDLEGGIRDYMIPVARNLTIEGYSAKGILPSIDLDYMRFRVGIGDGLMLVLRGLRLLGSARDPEEQLVFDFFGFGNKCTIVYEDLVAEVAVDHRRSLGRMGRLKTLPRVKNATNPHETLEKQKLEILHHHDPLCVATSGEDCASGAIAFEDFSNVVILADRRTYQEWGVILSIRRTLLIAVDVSQGWPKSKEEKAARLTVVVQNFADLALAIHNPHIATVHLWKDLVFGMSSWPNFNGERHLNCTLDHSLKILTHPLALKRFGMATIDFNFATNALYLTKESKLVLKYVLLDRTCDFSNPHCPLPFFNIGLGSQVVVESGYLRVSVSGPNLKLHDEGAHEMLSLGSPFKWTDVVHQISKLDECHDAIPGPCDRLGYLESLVIGDTSSVVAGANVFSPDRKTMGEKKTALLRNLTLILFDKDKHNVQREEDLLQQKEGILSVVDEYDLRQAMRNKSITGVYLTSSVNLSARVWPQEDQIILDRDFSMTTHPSSPVSMVVDFDFLSNRVGVQTGHTLSLEWMNFTRTSNNGDNMHYVPFFAWQDNSSIVFKDILAQMAIEPARTGALDESYLRSFRALPPPMWLDDPYDNFTQVLRYTSPKCLEVINLPCEDGALHILQMVQQVPLRDILPRDPLREGSGIFAATNMLFIANDIERAPLLTREQEQIMLHQQESIVEQKEHGMSLASSALMYSAVGVFVVVVTILALIYYHYKSLKLRAANSHQGGAQFEEKVLKEHHEIAPVLLGDVALGSLMGVGGFARVYRATWNGTPVAVKVILHRSGSVETSVRSEARLSITLRHPHLVQGYHFATRAVNSEADITSSAPEEGKSKTSLIVTDTNCALAKDLASKDYSQTIENSFGLGSYSDCQANILVGKGLAASVGSAGASTVGQDSVLVSDTSIGSTASQCETTNIYKETWLVQEFCDKGSLSDFLLAGNFMGPCGQQRNMAHIIRTGQDIARGMMYLHSSSIIHGDLKSSNVLLQQSATDPRGYIAKVADFGLSRKMVTDNTHMSTTSFGTVTHMPPEVLMQGHLSPRADVYSFGVILWEMIAGELPFRNMMQMEVMRKVVLEKKRPEIPSGTTEAYRILIEHCWCHEPQQRLAFRVILDYLDEMLDTFEQVAQE